MANETTVALTWKSKTTHFKSSNGNVGTLITFNELQKGGDFDGKNIIFWSANPEYREASKNGWSYDAENNRVIAPSLAEDEVLELKAQYAGKHDAKMQY